MNQLSQLRDQIRNHYLANETHVIQSLISDAALSSTLRQDISTKAADLVSQVRQQGKPSMMEKFLAEYGLTTKEGVALMCLAEAMLRVPDAYTIDALIEDKVGSGNWHSHLGQSDSSLVNTSTWALLITGKLIGQTEEDDSAHKKSITQSIRSLVKRLGEPVVRRAVAQAMKELGSQFVLGRNIKEACKRAEKQESAGYSYSYDMLGEAARTDADALRYHAAYSLAIRELTQVCKHDDIRTNPGISVKLSALHARYEYPQRESVMQELVPRTLSLAQQAKAGNMGFNIDAEEADRLDLSLDVIEAVLSDPSLADWNGFGVVVQAFGQRTRYVIDWLYALADKLDRKIMVRLVKGAYWDAEIKRAQVLGLTGYPVYTRKINSDVSYICCAKRLLEMTDRIYPQFATHNAHTVTAVLQLAQHISSDQYEFQRLHGMGESLHHQVLENNGTRCRIYAPVGAHQDLLAYLVRRLLENGANSSFVNQIVDTRITPQDIAKDPISNVEQILSQEAALSSHIICAPQDLYGEERRNAKGWDITDPVTIEDIILQRQPFTEKQWRANPIIQGQIKGGDTLSVYNPADPSECVGQVTHCHEDDVDTAISSAQEGYTLWSQTSSQHRADCLNRLADLFEEHAVELFSLASREAGKTLLDAVGEVREAVDFARYYANQAHLNTEQQARGVITCISPWNFPLAIFSGQILAALAAGNSVLAKPAEQTVLIAARAVELMHQAGIEPKAIQLIPGAGPSIGKLLTADERISGVCFTGSTLTAQHINKAMALSMRPDAPLIAETGGLNAMIVDSTALPEQVVRDVLASAFQSAGQRCSALRVLYLQEDIADSLLEMLYGAMDLLKLGHSWQLDTDIGPVIDEAARQKIQQHCDDYAAKGLVLKTLTVPQKGLFVAPTVIKISGIDELQQEIFGPVLHVATFAAKDLEQVIETINDQDYGLTFGLHTRVDNRVQQVISKIKAGNAYVNRNQIGAVVGSQPFGGEGLSGTGPKAGGPHYVKRFKKSAEILSDNCQISEKTTSIDLPYLQQSINTLNDNKQQLSSWINEVNRAKILSQVFPKYTTDNHTEINSAENMPGPTGELNLLSSAARGLVLCLGPSSDSALKQAIAALAQGNSVILIAQETSAMAAAFSQHPLADQVPLHIIEGSVNTKALENANHFNAVVSFANSDTLRQYRIALAQRTGSLIPLINETAAERFILERHLCIDTTAAGGNASLIAAVED